MEGEGMPNNIFHLPYKMGEKTIPAPVDLKNNFSFTLQTLHFLNLVGKVL